MLGGATFAVMLTGFKIQKTYLNTIIRMPHIYKQKTQKIKNIKT
jgi:hypothetical protein